MARTKKDEGAREPSSDAQAHLDALRDGPDGPGEEVIAPPALNDVPQVPDKAPTGSLIRKLSAIMGEVGYVEKKGINKFHNYTYVREADVLDAVRKAFTKHGVVFIPEIIAIDRGELGTTKTGTVMHSASVRMLIHLCDATTGQSMSFNWVGDGSSTDEKSIYKGVTGAVKYFLLKMFLMPSGDDPETDDAIPEGPAPKIDPKKMTAKPVSKPPEDVDPSLITDKQRKRLWAISKNAEMPEEILKELVESHGFKSSKDITKKAYDKICEAVEAWGNE